MSSQPGLKNSFKCFDHCINYFFLAAILVISPFVIKNNYDDYERQSAWISLASDGIKGSTDDHQFYSGSGNAEKAKRDVIADIVLLDFLLLGIPLLLCFIKFILRKNLIFNIIFYSVFSVYSFFFIAVLTHYLLK